MVLHYSFLELGQSALSHGRAWMTPVTELTNSIKEVQGGWSNMLRLFIKRLLFDRNNGFAVAGVPLDLRGERPVIVFAKLHCILADGAGLQAAFNWRGSSGLEPCLRHFNVFKKARCVRARWVVLG